MSLFKITPEKIKKWKKKKKVAKLIQALNSDVALIREYAAEALGEISNPEAVEPLIDALTDDDFWLSHRAAQDFSGMDQTTVEPMLEALTILDDNVRIKIVEALGKIGDLRAVESVKTVLERKSSSCRLHAANALKQLGWKPDPDRTGALYYIALGDFSNAAKSCAYAVAPLIRILKDPNADDDSEERSIRQAVAEALVKIEDLQSIDLLIKALKDEDNIVRTWIAKVLGNIGNPEAVEPLTQLLTDERRIVSDTAAEALGKIGDPRAVVSLMEVLEKNIGPVYEAAEALGKIGDPRAVKLLITTLKNLKSESISIAIGKMGKPALNPLIKVMQDKNPKIRELAVCALGEIKDQKATALLIAAMENETWIGKLAAEALENRGWEPGQDRAGALYYALQEDIDKCAAIGESAVKPLLKIGWKGDNKAVNTALTKIGKSNVAPLLAALELENNDEYHRKLAAKILKKIKWKPVQDRTGALYYIALENFKKCAEIGESAVEPLIKAMEDEDLFLEHLNIAASLKEIYLSGKLREKHKKMILAKKGTQLEGHRDYLATNECGFSVPPHTDKPPVYFDI